MFQLLQGCGVMGCQAGTEGRRKEPELPHSRWFWCHCLEKVPAVWLAEIVTLRPGPGMEAFWGLVLHV